MGFLVDRKGWQNFLKLDCGLAKNILFVLLLVVRTEVGGYFNKKKDQRFKLKQTKLSYT